MQRNSMLEGPGRKELGGGSETDKEEPRGGGIGEGWIGCFKLTDANYYIRDGQRTRSYCIVQGPMFSIL